MDPHFGHKFGYAFELLCDHFGEFLDNSTWSAEDADWPDQVQAALMQAGIVVRALGVIWFASGIDGAGRTKTA